MTSRKPKPPRGRSAAARPGGSGVSEEISGLIAKVTAVTAADNRRVSAGVRDLVTAHRKISALFTNPSNLARLRDELTDLPLEVERTGRAAFEKEGEEEVARFLLFEEARLASATPIYLTAPASGLVSAASFALPEPYVFDPEVDFPYPALIRIGDIGDGSPDDYVFLLSPAVEPKAAEESGYPELAFGLRTSFFHVGKTTERARYGSSFAPFAAYAIPDSPGSPISPKTASGHVRTFLGAGERAVLADDEGHPDFARRNAFIPTILALLRCGALRLTQAPPTPRHIGPEPLLLTPTTPPLPGEDAVDYTGRVARLGRWSHAPGSDLPPTRVSIRTDEGLLADPPRYPVAIPCWHIADSEDEMHCQGISGLSDEPWLISESPE